MRTPRFAPLWPSVVRYALAGVGPIAGAGVQFVLSLILLNLLSPAQFGSFSFLLVTSYFTAGLWSALFCAPLPVLLNEQDETGRRTVLRCLFGVNIAAAAVAGTAFLLIGIALAVPVAAAVLFAVYAAIFLLRWFGRAHAYATGAPLRATCSDLVYAGTLLVAIGVIAALRIESLTIACAALLVSAAAGLLPFGRGYLRRQFLSFHPRALADYAPIWRTHSGWSLVGVVTTEATVNAHVYIVTLLTGPAAYAPIAATALMIRPIGVAQNALTDFERARMAREIGAGRVAAALQALVHFRIALIAAWIVTGAGAIILFETAPRVVFPARYALDTLAIGTALWLAVAGVRLMRTPESALLQAVGSFRSLATASVVSCGFSVASVVALLVVWGPLWSIAGILAGEIVFAGTTWAMARRWRTARMPPSAPAARPRATT